MKRTLPLLALCLLAPAQTAFPSTPPIDESRDLDLVPHEILVRFRPGARAADVAARIPGLAVETRSRTLHLARLKP